MQVTVKFNHTDGGDGHLPEKDRGFFDGFALVVDAQTPDEAERLGMAAMYTMRAADHPEWVDRAIDDLCAEVWVDGVRIECNDDTWDLPFGSSNSTTSPRRHTQPNEETTMMTTVNLETVSGTLDCPGIASILETADADGRRQFIVASKSGTTYHVLYCGTGDGDPEIVSLWQCDCMAGIHGRLCKHVKGVTAALQAKEDGTLDD